MIFSAQFYPGVRKSANILVVIEEFVLASYFVGSLLKQHGLLYFQLLEW
jgi:hypothetical protein